VFVPESRAAGSRRPDPAGQVLLTVMLAALATAIIEGPGCGWLSPQTLGLSVLAATALAALAAYERRRADPLIQVRLFRSVPFAGANLTAVCAIAALAGFLFLTSVYLQEVRGMSALRAGLAVVPMPAEMAVCAPLAGRVIARRGSRGPAVAAGVALTLSCAALSGLTRAASPGFLALAFSLFGAGVGLASPVITYGVMSGVPRWQAGLASGINSSSRQLGQSLGIAVVGTVLAGSLHGPMRSGFTHAAQACWWIMAGCGYAVFLAALASTSGWAKTTAARLAEQGPRPRLPARPPAACHRAAWRCPPRGAVFCPAARRG
jgi:hypothetical protein